MRSTCGKKKQVRFLVHGMRQNQRAILGKLSCRIACFDVYHLHSLIRTIVDLECSESRMETLFLFNSAVVTPD